jgi:hypothetical protein
VEFDGLPLALLDSGADLLGRLALFVLEVGVVKLFEAVRADSGVRGFVAGAQAAVPHAVAVAVAGLLVDDVGDLCGKLVGAFLVRVLELRSPELLGRKNCGEFGYLGRRSGMVGRDASALSEGKHGDGQHGECGERLLHDGCLPRSMELLVLYRDSEGEVLTLATYLRLRRGDCIVSVEA